MSTPSDFISFMSLTMSVPWIAHCNAEQSAHGSPYHVHPYPSPIRLYNAFQGTSPKMFHPKGNIRYIDSKTYRTPSDSPILGRALCLTPKGSPIPGRVSHLNEKFQDSLTLTADTDTLVAKIGAMFPTVSETHIKILLKKYYNREAVVISALQVEKHPITTPGPLTMSPTVARLQRGAVGVYSAMQLAKGVSVSTGSTHHLTPMTGTPYGSPSLLRPSSGASCFTRASDSPSVRTHHSPKMKLKYLKNIFSKADETLILDVLANKDNNVQKATEELMSMGFAKKDTTIIKPVKKESPKPPKKVVTIMRTMEEKEAIKKKVHIRYPTLAERVVTLALESVDYNDERVDQILTAVTNEDKQPKKPSPVKEKSVVKQKESPPTLRPILKSTASMDSKYKSQFSISSTGPNLELRKGPKDSLLLDDYLVWNGPNPELRAGPMTDAREVRESPRSLAKGPNPAHIKGPAGLAKGSMYKKLTKNNNMRVH